MVTRIYKNTQTHTHRPVHCGGSGAQGCAGPASQAACPGQESCGWEGAAQRMQRSEPLGPASSHKQKL